VRAISAPLFHALALALALAGCASDSEEEQEQPEVAPPAASQPEELNRERIPVLTFEQQLEADPALADTQIILPLPYRNADWRQAVATPSHAPQHLWLDESLSRVWREDIGTGSDLFTRLIMSPVVADGRVFTIDTRGRVTAFRARDGERLWRERIEIEDEAEEMAFGGGLAFEDGRLYVTTGQGVLVALDAESGEEIWRLWEDVSNWHTWDHGLEYATCDGPFATGTTGHVKPKRGPLVKTRLTHVEPRRQFVDEGKLFLARLIFTHTLLESAEETAVTHRIEIRGPLAFFYNWVMGRAMRKTLPAEMEAMVAKAEQM